MQERTRQLQNINLHLEEEIRERILIENELLRKTIQLEAINKEMEAFSYSVSHDLRAPLRSLEGFSRALEEDYYDVLDDEGKDFLTRIRRNALKMSDLMDALLSLSHVTRQPLTIREVYLSTIAERIAHNLQQNTPPRNARFVIQPGLKVKGDANLLEILMQNLLGNAWKFTSHRQEAVISLESFCGENGPVYFIRDNGAGFDMRYADKIFSAFQRLHDSHEFEGTGIGLATVKRIINRHGGEVWAKAEPERVLRFSLHC
ncbi:MAG: GHKL domain-containing protein [Bacteroidia bacterium]|nr:GHKL domain-containing protein [Bacteroidia bacterium]